MILRNFVAAAFMLSSVKTMAFSGVGEQAYYKLDRSRARTSTLIRAGAVNVKISDAFDDASRGPVYKVHYNYDLQIAFMGRQVGEDDVNVPQRYFDEAFIDEVKDKGEIATAEFKIKYLGSKDITTNGGTRYADADMVLLYDINLERPGEFGSFVRGLLGVRPPLAGSGGFEDVKIKAAIKHGAVPVLGAASIDVSGVRQGMHISAGFDYVADAGSIK